jgi:hypothetical protein
MDGQIDPSTYLLGEAPRMTPVIRRVDSDPRLKALWEERFP